MKTTLLLTAIRIRLAFRNRAFIFFSTVMPLAYLFLYIGVFGRGAPRAVPFMLAPVLALTVMGSFWGLSIQLVMFREQGILRRFHLAPVSPSAMLASSVFSNYILILPTVLLEILLASWIFHLRGIGNGLAFWTIVSLGTAAFASLGLIVASVTNTMQETQVINNAIWFVFLFLSGATLPLALLPGWVQQFAVFLPATYLVTGLQQVLIRGASVAQVAPEIVALSGGLSMAFFISVQLFRWEPESKVTGRAKLWAAATIIPFLLLGAWESSSGRLRSDAKANLNSINQPEQPKAGTAGDRR